MLRELEQLSIQRELNDIKEVSKNKDILYICSIRRSAFKEKGDEFMNYRNANELHDEAIGELPYGDQRFYMPRLKLNRALYPEGELIPVVDFVKHDIYKDGQSIANHDFAKALKSQPEIHYNEFQPPIDQWQPSCA